MIDRDGFQSVAVAAVTYKGCQSIIADGLDACSNLLTTFGGLIFYRATLFVG